MKNIIVDEDGDRVFAFKNGVCPFWNSERLCDIQKKYGEQHICETCRSFPRICQDYTEFSEYMLSLACPEACRMIITSNNPFAAFTISEINSQSNGYQKEFMNFLLFARKQTAALFSEKTVPFKTQLKKCILFTEYVQALIDEECFNKEKLLKYVPEMPRDENRSRKFVFEMHRKLDIMDKNWLEELIFSADSCPKDTERTDFEYRNIALYYIYRYYLNAIDSYDVITTIKRIYCAYVVCSAMTAKRNAENNFSERNIILQRYSKEIEHSDVNSSLLSDIFMFDPDFSSENLVCTL